MNYHTAIGYRYTAEGWTGPQRPLFSFHASAGADVERIAAVLAAHGELIPGWTEDVTHVHADRMARDIR